VNSRSSRPPSRLTLGARWRTPWERQHVEWGYDGSKDEQGPDILLDACHGNSPPSYYRLGPAGGVRIPTLTALKTNGLPQQEGQTRSIRLRPLALWLPGCHRSSSIGPVALRPCPSYRFAAVYVPVSTAGGTFLQISLSFPARNMSPAVAWRFTHIQEVPGSIPGAPTISSTVTVVVARCRWRVGAHAASMASASSSSRSGSTWPHVSTVIVVVSCPRPS